MHRAGIVLAAPWTKCRAWAKQHPWQAGGALAVLTALFVWCGRLVALEYEARGHMQSARAALYRQEWTQAHVELTACLQQWPNSYEAHLLDARATRRLGLADEATAHLDRCEHLHGSAGQAVLVERALLRVQQGDLTGNETFLRAAVAHDDPDTAEILDILSIALGRELRVPEAHACLDELLRRQPDHYEALVRHGATAANQGWHDVAVQSLDKAVRLRPQDSDVRLSLAQNLIVVGRYPEAQQHLQALQDQEPDNPAVQFALARCLGLQGQREKAGQLLDRLLAKDPFNWTVLNERGWIDFELDRPEEAERHWRLAQSLAPTNQAILTRLADCLRLLGKLDEARLFREKAERQRDQAVRCALLVKRIHEERPVTADLYHELACGYVELAQDREALFYFDKALQLDPRHRPTHESLVQFYTKLGDSRSAESHARQLGKPR
jgi:tetratricopeptide (TPR) repeat protein